jgi:hypothetical protein
MVFGPILNMCVSFQNVFMRNNVGNGCSVKHASIYTNWRELAAAIKEKQ